MSPSGPSPEVQTPNIDALAASGVILTSFYTWKFCSPSRSVLLSGRHPIHVNIHNDGAWAPEFGIPENMTLLPRKLATFGYVSHHLGKWHVGVSTPSRTPRGRGFDSSLGYMFGLNDYLHGLSYYGCNGTSHDFAPGTEDWLARPEDVDRRCTIRSINGRHLHHYTDLWEAGEAGEGPAVGLNGTAFEESLFASRAVGIIESHDPSTPLFLYYAMHLLVSPLCAPLEYLDRFAFIADNQDRRYVAAMTAMMDDIVGDVVIALKQSGLWENTLLIWSSDNGAAIELDNGAKNAYPLKGGYYTDWEGGVRAPAVVNGGILPQKMRGRHLDGLVHISDWLPTFVVGLAGGNTSDPLADADRLPPVDGVNQWPYISGDVDVSARTEVGFTPLPDTNVSNQTKPPHSVDGNRAEDSKHSAIIVMINGSKIKLITGAIAQASWEGPQYPNGTRPDNVTIGVCDNSEIGCWDTWSTVEQCTVPPGCSSGGACKLGCLYNLTADPTEHVDLALELPDLTRTMYSRLEAFSATLYDPYRGVEDPEAVCAAVEANAGFFGPWLRDGSTATNPIRI